MLIGLQNVFLGFLREAKSRPAASNCLDSRDIKRFIHFLANLVDCYFDYIWSHKLWLFPNSVQKLLFANDLIWVAGKVS